MFVLSILLIYCPMHDVMTIVHNRVHFIDRMEFCRWWLCKRV